MHVLVTGGTGFVGKHLVHALLKNNNTVRLLVRKSSNIKEFEGSGVEFSYGDISNKDSLTEALQNIDIVYHLAGQVGQWGLPDEQFYAINVQGTQNLLEAGLATGIKQFIYCSTPGVQGKGHLQAKESEPYNPPYIYEKTKCEAEKLSLKFFEDHKLPVTVIRPDFVYGPDDLRRISLFRSIKNKKFFIVGNGKAVLHPTYIDDVVQGFELVRNNPTAFGEIYNIAGPQPISVDEFVTSICKSLNVPPPAFKIPKFIGVIAAFVFETLSNVTGKAPFISRSKIEFLTVDHGTDISKARQELGYQPQYPFQKGIQLTIDWYKKHQHL